MDSSVVYAAITARLHGLPDEILKRDKEIENIGGIFQAGTTLTQ
ncbi:hypothetical protein [Variovorax sp. HJSM1_2]